MRTFILLIAMASQSVTVWAGPRYALEVDGLACPFCAYGLEKRLGRESGFKQVETQIANGRVVVEFEDDTSLTESRARQAVEEAGFTLRGFEILEDE